MLELSELRKADAEHVQEIAALRAKLKAAEEEKEQVTVKLGGEVKKLQSNLQSAEEEKVQLQIKLEHHKAATEITTEERAHEAENNEMRVCHDGWLREN